MRFDWREIVSRLAMLFMAALCAAGAVGLFHAGNVIYPYESASSGGSRHGEGSMSYVFYTGGTGLLGAGGVLAVSAFKPPRKD
ncbi:MAG TPA: hypothetical protein VIM11_15580 [Tepidisphaeraceae bacterium]